MSMEMTWLEFQLPTDNQNGCHLATIFFFFFFRILSKPGIYIYIGFRGAASLLVLSVFMWDWKRGCNSHFGFINFNKSIFSVSSRIQKGHGATDHWGHLIMPAWHPVDSLGHFQHPPSQLRVQTKSVNYAYVDISSYYHYVHKPLSGIVSQVWTRDISDRGVFHCDNGLGGLNMT